MNSQFIEEVLKLKKNIINQKLNPKNIAELSPYSIYDWFIFAFDFY